ncbi:hypothetical protein BRC77_08845, partial [Halobacteriales archaeon QH_8_64_26]
MGEATGVSPDRRAGVAAQTNGTVNETDTRRNGSLAGEISSFMQITAASSEGAIDSGMWRAELNDTENASERARMIASRIEYLKEWETEIEDETTTLQADRNNNTSVSYVARASRLAARIEAFRTAVNQTAAVAAAENASRTEVNRLKNASANLTGSDLPAVDEKVSTGPAISTTPTGSTGSAAPNATPSPSAGTAPRGQSTPTSTAPAVETSTATATE